MTTLKSKSFAFIILFLILVIFLLVNFWGLGKSFLYDWDEGIYAQVAQESGFSLSLYWNGQPWFEKPPLIFWLTNFSFLLFGKNEFGARFFMPILGATSLVFSYFLISERINRQVALLASSFLLVLPLFLARSQGLNIDSALLAGLAASLFFLTRLEKKLKQKIAPSFFDYLFPALMISLAILAKGVMGFLPGLIWLVYLALFPKKLLFKYFRAWLIVGLITIILVAPWHIYQTVRFGGEFWQVYFIEHIIRRAYQPIEYHFGGKLYYIKFLISEFGWWLMPIVGGGLIWLFEQIKRRKASSSFVFFLAWGGVVFNLFTFAKTKLFWYILPLYPVLAILWGYFWQKIFSFKKFLFLLPIFFIFLLALNKKYQFLVRNEPSRPDPKIVLALKAKDNCLPPLLFLVNKNERAAADILPKELALSSSFSYGGSPSVVFYFTDKVNFFYRLDQFEERLTQKPDSGCAMITQEDYQDLGLKRRIVDQNQEWLLIN
jgi:4-amino-4-deoxy-L-arabinose transferase-like glycosyltransferase